MDGKILEHIPIFSGTILPDEENGTRNQIYSNTIQHLTTPSFRSKISACLVELRLYRVTYCNGKCEGGGMVVTVVGRGDIIELWWQWCKHARVNLYPYIVFFFHAFSAF